MSLVSVCAACFFASSIAMDTLLISTVPCDQSILGLWRRSHGNPRIIDCLPSEVTRSLVHVRLPSQNIFRQAQCVIGPEWLGEKSTLRTGMGCGSGRVGISCFLTKSESINCPSAPESMSAVVGTVWVLERILTGKHIVVLFKSVNITGEIVTGGDSVLLFLLSKNPCHLGLCRLSRVYLLID